MTQTTITNSVPKYTPLYSLHQEQGARIVTFAGYEMPLVYQKGIVQEHLHTRTKASLFDVSHMGQVSISGKDPAKALETLTVGNIQSLASGAMLYTLLTNDQGGIIDDLIIMRLDERFRLIINAARRSIDIDHLCSHLDDYAIESIENQTLLALQGPQASSVLGRHLPDIVTLPFLHIKETTLNHVPVWVCRSGYTGEDGFELCLPSEGAESIAHLLLEDERVELAGLGCRDTLRLEAGLCLYGNDLDETTTPVEAALKWTIGKRRRIERNFPGADIILDQLSNGPLRYRVGLCIESQTLARQNTVIVNDTDTQIGIVTSGNFSPTLNQPIAMGYVDAQYAQVGQPIGLRVRNRQLNGQITPLPFISPKYFRG